jgi:cell shape-determining protein MreC
MLAAVLKHPPLVPFDELIIDIGSEDGVAVGNKVYAVGNVIIGRVVDVLGNTSKVSLLSSPGESFSSIVGAGKISGTAFGRGGGQYEISLPRDTVVSIGDVVSVPSIDHQIVGIVSAIIKDPAEPFQKVIFIPPMNIYDARWVFVSKKK